MTSCFKETDNSTNLKPLHCIGKMSDTNDLHAASEEFVNYVEEWIFEESPIEQLEKERQLLLNLAKERDEKNTLVASVPTPEVIIELSDSEEEVKITKDSPSESEEEILFPRKEVARKITSTAHTPILPYFLAPLEEEQMNDYLLTMSNHSSPNSPCQTFGSTIVDSHYLKKEDIGRGHFGVVWRAVSKFFTSDVYAIKEICIAGTKDNQLQDKIEGEIDIVKRLNHKNIVQFIEHFYDLNKKTFYVVMEFCINGDLSDAIKTKRDAGRTFPVNLVKKWYTELIQAVQYLHKIMKIWHRDLKPSNIFLNGENSLKLGDFGVSKVLEYSSELASTYCGTRLYMAPEVLTRGGQYNSRADMFSIGVILYEVITLRRPFPTEKHLWNYCNDNGDYEDINPIDHPDFARHAPYLLDLVPRLLSKNPSGRPKAEKCRIWKCLDDQEKENESPNKCTCKNVVKKQRTTPTLYNLSSRPTQAVLNCWEDPSVAKYLDRICCMCKTTENMDTLLICDKCDKGYHMYCLDLPFGFAPERPWFCFRCQTHRILH